MIQTECACLEFTATGAVTTFYDGAMYGALPHNTPSYFVVSHRLGYGDDILRYSQEHELGHLLIGEVFGGPSKVLWALAHGKTPSRREAAAEEALVMCLQRFARANEVPMIDSVPWDALKRRFLALLDVANKG